MEFDGDCDISTMVERSSSIDSFELNSEAEATDDDDGNKEIMEKLKESPCDRCRASEEESKSKDVQPNDTESIDTKMHYEEINDIKMDFTEINDTKMDYTEINDTAKIDLEEPSSSEFQGYMEYSGVYFLTAQEQKYFCPEREQTVENFNRLLYKKPQKLERIGSQTILTNVPNSSEFVDTSSHDTFADRKFSRSLFQPIELEKQLNPEIWNKASLLQQQLFSKEGYPVYQEGLRTHVNDMMAIATASHVSCLSWSANNEHLILGTSSGLLKAFYFNESSGNVKKFDLSKVSIVNQTLEGHETKIIGITWNTFCNQFISVDCGGIIISWMLDPETSEWVAKMINTFQSTEVYDIQWSPNGALFAILYQDLTIRPETRMITVGNENGDTMWTQTHENSNLRGLFWSTDSSELVAYDKLGCFHVYSHSSKHLRTSWPEEELAKSEQTKNNANFVLKVLLNPNDPSVDKHKSKFVIIWHMRRLTFCAPNEQKVFSVDTRLVAKCAEWSCDGNHIAIGGIQPIVTTYDEQKALQLVHIFNTIGSCLAEIKIEDKSTIGSIAWFQNGDQMAIGTENTVQFLQVIKLNRAVANENIVAVCYNKEINFETCHFVSIWSKNSNEVKTQQVPGIILDMKVYEEKFIILSRHPDDRLHHAFLLDQNSNLIDLLCILTMEPFCVSLCYSCIVFLSCDFIMTWRCMSGSLGHIESVKSPGHKDSSKKKTKQIHIDDLQNNTSPRASLTMQKKRTKDPAVCMDSKGQTLIVGRWSGRFQLYALPQCILLQSLSENELNGISPRQIFLNYDCSRCAVIDRFHEVIVIFLKEKKQPLCFSEKLNNVYNLRWCDQSPLTMGILQDGHLVQVHDAKITKNSKIFSKDFFIASFKKMEITLVNSSTFLSNLDNLHMARFMEKVETKSFQELQEAEESGTLFTVLNDLEKNGTLSSQEAKVWWSKLAKQALYNGDFDNAEIAYAKSNNYPMIKFIQEMRVIESPDLRKAEILLHLGNFQEACVLYDKLQDKKSYVVAKLLSEDFESLNDLTGDSDVRTTGVFTLMGDHYFFRGEYFLSVLCYAKEKSYAPIVKCLEVMEDFQGMAEFSKKLPKSEITLLTTIAKTLEHHGMIAEATSIYTRLDMVNEAIECAVDNRCWDVAFMLSQKSDYAGVGAVIDNYVRHLLNEGSFLEATNILKDADKFLMSSQLLCLLAYFYLHELSGRNILFAKKLFILTAKAMNRKRLKTTELGNTGLSFGDNFSHSLGVPDDYLIKKGLIEEPLILENAISPSLKKYFADLDWLQQDIWRGAAATHFALVFQQLMYKRAIESSIQLAFYLLNFVDILGQERCDSFLSIACLQTQHGQTLCHQSLCRLETKYQELSCVTLKLADDEDDSWRGPAEIYHCLNCDSLLKPYGQVCKNCQTPMSYCIVSGCCLTAKSKPMSSLNKDPWKCPTCRREACWTCIDGFNHCPLCHSALHP